MKFIKYMAILITLLVFTGYAKILPVPLFGAENNHHAWAAHAQMILAYYFIDKTQEEIVKVVNPDTPHFFKHISTALNHYGISNNFDGNITYSERQMKAQIDNEHPFVIFWHWIHADVGHTVLISGYSGDLFTASDVLPPEVGNRYEGTYKYITTANNEGWYRGTLWTTEDLEPFIELRQPNGGEMWSRGSHKSINWKGKLNGWFGTVAIELLKGGLVKEVITGSYPHDSSYIFFAWDIGANLEEGSDYKIRIKDNTTTGQSENTFSIVNETVYSIPYTQSFDGFATGTILSEHWEQRFDDDIQWTCWKGMTPSREKQGQTGAEGDYPKGSGNYMYIESSAPNYPGKTASMISPKINLQNTNDPALSFRYHMFSATGAMGNLFLDICVDGVWREEVVHIQGDQGDKWHKKDLDLTPYKGARVQFRFRGVSGANGYSDICIDDLKVNQSKGVILQDFTGVSGFFLWMNNGQVCYRVPANHPGGKIPVLIKLYSVNGKHIGTLVNEHKASGKYSVPLKNRAAAGLFLCEMRVAGKMKTKKFIVNR